MNRKAIINQQRALSIANKRYPDHLIEVRISDFTLPVSCPGMTKYPTRAWRSSRFFVQEFTEREGVTRLTINRTQIGNDGQWLDGITWEQLQTIKHQCGYGDRDAVEAYPADKDVQNVANMRHLFVFDEPLEFIWRSKC